MIETQDLIIRETEFQDLEFFHAWERMPEVTEFFSIPAGQSKEDLYHKYFLDKDDSTAAQFTILLRSQDATTDPVPIGRIVLADIIPGWKAEIWRIYIADPRLRGKGYGKQALLAMVHYCFRELALQRLYLDFYSGNPAEFLYKKVGFVEEGVLRGNCRKDGILHDVHLMSMLRAEYEALYAD
jgi:RimJ/RimL family protein N-acetyltransferase